MTIPRLDRRLTILRGKRQGAFDPDQYYLEEAIRARVARKTRCYLRNMQPVVLITPRWSQPRRFLDDVAVDLAVGEPSVHCRTLSFRPLDGRTPHQAWSWLVQAIVEFCGLSVNGEAWQAVSRHGFRVVMKELFRRAEQEPRRCLMIHSAEHIHVEALQDFISVFEDHLHHRTTNPGFNLLLAGAVDAPHLEFQGARRLLLPDFNETEALEALVEHLGPDNLPRLRSLVATVGGIPAVIDALGTEAAGRISDVVADRRSFWRTLGPLGQEIRRAFDIVAADPSLSARLQDLASHGPLPPDSRRDARLLKAGLIHQVGRQAHRTTTQLRAPVFADLT
ncbi:MAG: hypothetical protein KTR31_20350 [Myxococcales bacterium]|nr:hypothetical protein [Myxococcales bacterium]